MILISLNHTNDAIIDGGVPRRRVHQQASDSVRFHIGLVHHINTELTGFVRSMRGGSAVLYEYDVARAGILPFAMIVSFSQSLGKCCARTEETIPKRNAARMVCLIMVSLLWVMIRVDEGTGDQNLAYVSIV
jgi:hypothetical protein